MRMRDKPTIAVEMSIAAPPARVWELVTDLQLMGHWSPEYQGGEWLDGASGLIVDARFKGRNKRRGREWESVSTVLEAAPGRSFVWAVGNPTKDRKSTRLNSSRSQISYAVFCFKKKKKKQKNNNIKKKKNNKTPNKSKIIKI